MSFIRLTLKKMHLTLLHSCIDLVIIFKMNNITIEFSKKVKRLLNIKTSTKLEDVT